jgi:hypothetical protein
VVEKNVEMRRVLAAQLREKEWRRKQMADEEATRFGIFKQSLAEAQVRAPSPRSPTPYLIRNNAQIRPKLAASISHVGLIGPN